MSLQWSSRLALVATVGLVVNACSEDEDSGPVEGELGGVGVNAGAGATSKVGGATSSGGVPGGGSSSTGAAGAQTGGVSSTVAGSSGTIPTTGGVAAGGAAAGGAAAGGVAAGGVAAGGVATGGSAAGGVPGGGVAGVAGVAGTSPSTDPAPLRSCLDILAASPSAADGVYTIDVDGPGAELPIDVYCDMTTAGGGWQMVSAVRNDQANVPIVGTGYCTSVSTDSPCHGHMHPAQVSANSEILVRAGADRWLIYSGFSATAASALRYFSNELAITASDDCTLGDHVCGDTTRDPDLTVLRTSGFPEVYTAPLAQWWRAGGWWIGANPNSGATLGRIHASSYGVSHDLRLRTAADADTEQVSNAHQLIFHRSVDKTACSNTTKDGTETAVDCGGACAPCPVGSACLDSNDCASLRCNAGSCDNYAHCLDRIVARPNSPSTVYTIDPDGASGGTTPFQVYCDMDTNGGGWQLISVVLSGDTTQVIVGNQICATLSIATACKGHILPTQVTSTSEVLVRSLVTSEWISYKGFSGTASSALRYFSGELSLIVSDSCTEPHVCADTTRDPALAVAATSGYGVNYTAPLKQWWRHGGWWIGADPNAGSGDPSNTGRIHASSYSGAHDLRSRATATTATALVTDTHQALLYRPNTR